jgi:lipid-A-disaccharide synthase
LTRLREAVRILAPLSDTRDFRRILVVAGEASGDLHGSHLVKAIRDSHPDVTFWGIGGDNMAQAGVKILVSSSDMAVVGLTEVLHKLHTIVTAANKMKSALKNLHPDLLILIDYPEFNLYLARFAKRMDIPVLYYISPQVWAWRRGRIKKISRRVDRMAVILPFEESFYRKRGFNVEYVGHPLLDEFASRIQDRVPQEEPRQQEAGPQSGTGFQHPTVGLLPGSRKDEIRNLLPVMIKSVAILKTHYPNVRCLLPLAKTIEREYVETFLQETPLHIEVRQGDIYGMLAQCQVALVASGTATLDTAIMGVPMVVIYKVTPISYWLGRILIKVPYIGLANLVAGERVVPELIQDDATPERLAAEALSLLEDAGARKAMIERLNGIRKDLGKGGASQRAASIAIEMMK